MTDGEKLIWAAAYAIEYNRWTCGDEVYQPSPEADAKVTRIAFSQAAISVLAARVAVTNIKASSPTTVSMFARQLVRLPQPKTKRTYCR